LVFNQSGRFFEIRACAGDFERRTIFIRRGDRREPPMSERR